MDSGMPLLRRLRFRLEFWGLLIFGNLVRILPLAWLRPIARLAGAAVFALDRHGSAVALANLESALGDALPPARRKAIARESYQNFARTMLELFWSPNLTAETAARIARFEDRGGNLKRTDGRPIICVCLHFSNFEWLSQFTCFHASRAMVVTQKFKNPLIGPLFDRLRRSTGHEVIPQERAMIRMLKHLKRGGRFHVVIDLNLDPREPSVIIDQFGGLKSCVTQIHAALAEKTGALIVPAECRLLPDGSYEMILHDALEYPEGAPVREIVQRCWNVLEPGLRGQPGCWLWSYKHWRFRPEGAPNGRYPFYANTAKRFDKLLAQESCAS